MNLSHQIELQKILTPLDWFVFILVFAFTVGLVLYGHKTRKKDLNQQDKIIDLILMGRQLTLPLFVATLVATWYGGIFGVTRIAFEQGIYNFVTQGVFWYITYIIFALFMVKKIRSYQAVTLPDLVGQMFGPKSALLSAIFNLFNVLPIAYIIGLGIFIQLIFPISLPLAMIFGTMIVLIYSLFGGLRAVVFSDLAQFFVMCLSVFLILIFSIYRFGGVNYLWQNLPAQHFSLTGGNSIMTTLVWGFIALSTLVDPNFYQRCFAAKTTATAKKGILISTFVWFCFDICTTLGAMYARVAIPQADPGQAYLIYALQILPPGLRGFVLAGILATILSTLDSYLFLAGTTLSHDILKAKKNRVNFHYLSLLMISIISIILASTFKGNIKLVWKTLGSYSAACLLWPMLYGHFSKNKLASRYKDQQFFYSCIMGVIAITLWKIAPKSSLGALGELDELYIGVMFTSLTIFIYPVFYNRLIPLIHKIKMK